MVGRWSLVFKSITIEVRAMTHYHKPNIYSLLTNCSSRTYSGWIKSRISKKNKQPLISPIVNLVDNQRKKCIGICLITSYDVLHERRIKIRTIMHVQRKLPVEGIVFKIMLALFGRSPKVYYNRTNEPSCYITITVMVFEYNFLYKYFILNSSKLVQNETLLQQSLDRS